MNKNIILASVLIAAVAVSYFFISDGAQNSLNTTDTNAVVDQSVEAEMSTYQYEVPDVPAELLQEPEPNTDQLIVELAKRLKEEFGDSIRSIAVQVGLKEFRTSLEQEYPGEGRAMFEQVLALAFPELADEILNALASMDEYDAWLVDSYLDLNEMNALARDNTIWNKRIEIFGEANARLIWNEEVAQEIQREQNVMTVMHELNDDVDMTISDRVYTMQAVMRDNYGDTPAALMIGTGNVTTELVFRLDSIQRDLAAMDSEQRQETINQMRLQLGFPEERIDVLAEFDQKNNEMWEKGYAYMAEREALVASYQGDDLETELDTLRVKHFEDRHAYTIKQEESDGLMRYERERVFGLN